MTYGTHLRRSRHGSPYFRNVIPSDVRGSTGKSELSISLGTASKRGAELAALELELEAKRFVEGAREAIRINEPVKSNLAALHAVMRVRQYVHVVGELNEADLVIADQGTQIETLTAKLISRLDVPRAEPVSVADPTLVAAVQAFKAEPNATGKWTVKMAAMWDSRLRVLLDWFGDVPVSGLSREGMIGFFNALSKLPKNASKYNALDGLTMRELIEVEGFDRIAPSTVNLIMECSADIASRVREGRVDGTTDASDHQPVLVEFG